MKLGEIIGVGKQTVFGLGKISIGAVRWVSIYMELFKVFKGLYLKQIELKVISYGKIVEDMDSKDFQTEYNLKEKPEKTTSKLLEISD